MLTLSVLKLLSTDMELLSTQLDAKIATAPGMFRQMPVLIDLEALPKADIDFPALVALLRERSLMPVGVRGADEAQIKAAGAAGLGLMSGGSDVPSRPVRTEPKAESKPEKAAEPERSGSLLIRQPVRSGQQIYARGGDLVVLAPVSAGAEVLADGHIHVYGALRGRALAGVQGNTEARIFCHSLEAELISIAGIYRVSERIEDSERGHPVQVFLSGEALSIESLKP